METLAQYGCIAPADLWGCSLYGLIMLTLSVWLALNLKKPEKD